MVGVGFSSGSMLPSLSTQFINNQSGTLGGGLYAGYAGLHSIRLNGGLIQGNSAPNGGGLYSDSSFTLQNTSIYSNTATNGRGGGALSTASVSVANSTFAYNTVTTGGNGGGLVAELELPSPIRFFSVTVPRQRQRRRAGGRYQPEWRHRQLSPSRPSTRILPARAMAVGCSPTALLAWQMHFHIELFLELRRRCLGVRSASP